jgi:hypothetical protein
MNKLIVSAAAVCLPVLTPMHGAMMATVPSARLPTSCCRAARPNSASKRCCCRVNRGKDCHLGRLRQGSYCGPQTDEMQSYVAANPKHSEYHYTDLPFQYSHYHDHDVGSADNDIVQTLKQCIQVLQGKDDASSNPHASRRVKPC